MPADPKGRGFTPRELANRWRVSPARIRQWIRDGDLPALNLSLGYGKTRLIVTPEGVREFERRRSAAPPPRVKRRRRAAAAVDFLPDL